MAEAAAEGRFEEAAALRDQLSALDSGQGFRRQQPGRMGLGTDQQAYRPPAGWVPPKRPDPMTASHSKRGRKRQDGNDGQA